MTRRPPAGRARSRVPSCARTMLLHDGQPEADADVLVGAHSFVPRWNGSVRVGISSARSGRPVFSTRSTLPSGCDSVWTVTVPPAGRLWTIAFWTRFVTIRSMSGAEPTVWVVSPVDVERDPALLGEGQQRLAGFLGDDGEIDGLAGEGPAVGPAEQQECLGEVDRPRVDDSEAFDELADVAVGIVAGDLEHRLRDRQRGAQLVGRVRCEPLLFGDVGFEPGEHGVEVVGESAELVVAARDADPVGERSVAAMRVASVIRVRGAEHAAGEQPPSQEPEHQEEGQHDGRGRRERVRGGRSRSRAPRRRSRRSSRRGRSARGSRTIAGAGRPATRRRASGRRRP